MNTVIGAELSSGLLVLYKLTESFLASLVQIVSGSSIWGVLVLVDFSTLYSWLPVFTQRWCFHWILSQVTSAVRSWESLGSRSTVLHPSWVLLYTRKKIIEGDDESSIRYCDSSDLSCLQNVDVENFNSGLILVKPFIIRMETMEEKVEWTVISCHHSNLFMDNWNKAPATEIEMPSIPRYSQR